MRERRRELLILVAGDILVFAVSLWLTLLVRYLELPATERLVVHAGPFALLTGVWIVLFVSAGLYDKHTTLLKQTLRNRIVYVQCANMVLAAFLFIIIPFGIAPKLNLFIYLIVSTLLLSWWRLAGFHFFSPKERHKAILIADGTEAVELVDEINNNNRYNYAFVRIIDESLFHTTEGFEAKLLHLIESENIKIVVASKASEYAGVVMPAMFDLTFLKFRSTLLDFATLYEDTFDRVPLSAINYDWFMANLSLPKSPLYTLTKRGFDIFGALLLALPAAAIFPLVAVAIKLDDKGPLFYFTERVGQFDRPIKIWKFRTKNGRDTGGEALSSVLVDTRVGSFLRKTRIDELPQLFNVLRGDLSFIGPRPEMPELATVYSEQIPYYNARHFIKPGLSGWAQINDLDAPRGGVDIERTTSKLSYDLLYMKRQSFVLDAQIAVKTLATIVMRTGS